MKKERYETLKDVALRIQNIVEEAFGKERVNIQINCLRDCPVDIYVGEIGKTEEFYIYCGDEWLTDSRKYLVPRFGTVDKFRFEEEVS